MQRRRLRCENETVFFPLPDSLCWYETRPFAKTGSGQTNARNWKIEERHRFSRAQAAQRAREEAVLQEQQSFEQRRLQQQLLFQQQLDGSNPAAAGGGGGGLDGGGGGGDADPGLSGGSSTIISHPLGGDDHAFGEKNATFCAIYI
jgi:hypothetical protein